MVYGTQHGASWYDSKHQWDPATATAPPVLNDVNKEPRVLPQTVVDGVTGWYDLADFIDNREGRTYGKGEIQYPPRVTGKTLVYECHIEAASRLDFHAIITATQVGFGDREVEGAMTVTPWLPFGGATPVVWTYYALVTALAFDRAPKLQEDGITYQWGYVLTLRMSDATFYPSGGGS